MPTLAATRASYAQAIQAVSQLYQGEALLHVHINLKATSLSLLEIRGQKCYQAWGLDRLCRHCPVTKVIETGEIHEAELTPQNQEHWPSDQGSWLSRAAPVKDDTGSIIGAIEVAYNITERKQAEEALRNSREKLLRMFEAVTDGVTVTDLNGIITEANKTVAKIHGFDSERELLGRRIFEFIAQHDRERAIEHMHRTLKKGPTKGIEMGNTIILSSASKTRSRSPSALVTRSFNVTTTYGANS